MASLSPSTSTSSDLDTINCQICCQPCHGNHFGAYSCRACAAFFRRSIIAKIHNQFKCRLGNGNCQPKLNGKFICKKCRLNRCFEAGMTTDKLQHDRDLISSTDKFAVSKIQKKILSSRIPQTVQGFCGRPLFLLSCEPDLATSTRTFVDMKYLIDFVSDIFDNSDLIQTEEPSKTVLQKLSYALETTRSSSADAKLCNVIGKAEVLIFWEHEFTTVAKWLTYCDEFQQLPKRIKMLFLKSMWYMWMRLERIATAAEVLRKNCGSYAMTHEISVDLNEFNFDTSWFTKYSQDQLSYFLDPAECLMIPQIMDPFNELSPSLEEVTYMLCLISFRHAGKQNGGDIQQLTDKLIDHLANDLHNYYLSANVVNYAGRLTKMAKVVQLIEKEMNERRERMGIARLLNIFAFDLSHPDWFYGFEY